MKQLLLFFLFFTFKVNYSQNIAIIKIVDLEKRIHAVSDTTYIVNFWATWCVPCIKELPAFDSIQLYYQKQPVKVLLVTLDFKEELDSKVLPFIAKKKIKSEIALLDEINGNYFIPRVSDDWTGAIPATLILNTKKQKRLFFEKKVDFNFLKTQIDAINQQ